MIHDYSRVDEPPDGVETWTTEELTRDFDVHGFSAPYVVVTRKSDGAKGTLEFIHSPRVYFGFQPDGALIPPKYTLIPHEVIVVPSIPPCNFCSDGTPGPYDFKTRSGPWANGCEEHYLQYRAFDSLGTGRGQLWITEDQVQA